MLIESLRLHPSQFLIVTQLRSSAFECSLVNMERDVVTSNSVVDSAESRKVACIAACDRVELLDDR